MARGSRAGARSGSLAGPFVGRLVGLGLSSLPAMVPVAAWAGAWTWDAGTGEVGITALASTADQLFDGDRNLGATPRYDKFEFTGLFEYGATDWLTLMASSQFQHIDIASPTDAQRTGLGYSEFGARARLYQWNDWVFSVQTLVRLPGTADTGNPAAIGFTDTQVEVRGLIGRNFALGPFAAFFDAEIGQRFRTQGVPDEFRADFTIGVQTAPKWTILAQSFNVISEGAGAWGFGSYDYYKFQLSAVYQLTPKLSLQFGGFTAYTGRNSIQENGGIVGAWYRF